MKAVIYARYSCDSQREESIEGQLRECREYAKRNGITILGEYIDRAMTGRNDDRPEFQRMIKDSYLKKFDILLVWKLDTPIGADTVTPVGLISFSVFGVCFGCL